MAGSTTPCLFCGRSGVKLTKEHVYPRWLHRALNIRGPITISAGIRPARTVSEFDLQVREVCETCNGRWLHDLERAFRSVMLLPLNGYGPILLPQPVQLVVALWAVKVWLLLERSLTPMRGEYVSLEQSPEMFRWLREHSEPVPDTQVWVGAVHAEAASLISFVSPNWVGTPPDPPVGIAGVFTIGHVLFQVYMPITGVNRVPSVQTFALGIGGGLASYLTQIWPHEVEEISWPPPRIFTVDDLHRLWPPGGHIQPGPRP
jgi:hypothetical protein